MKRFIFSPLIMALLLVFVLSFTACDNGTTGGGGSSSFASTNWKSSYFSGQRETETRLSFITSGDWAIYVNYEIAGMGWYQMAAGTYTVSGGTATLAYLYANEYGKATISGNTLTLLGPVAAFGSSWTRE